MVAPAIGAVVLVRFPFSDLSQSKLRPAVVLADAGRVQQVLLNLGSNAFDAMEPRGGALSLLAGPSRHQ